MTFTVDPDFIYAMLKEYNDAVMARNIGGGNLDEAYLALFDGDIEVRRGSLNCVVSTVPGGAKIVCAFHDDSYDGYTTNGAAYRYSSYGYTYELYRVSFPSVTKDYEDVLSVYATAVLTVG